MPCQPYNVTMLLSLMGSEILFDSFCLFCFSERIRLSLRHSHSGRNPALRGCSDFHRVTTIRCPKPGVPFKT